MKSGIAGIPFDRMTQTLKRIDDLDSLWFVSRAAHEFVADKHR